MGLSNCQEAFNPLLKGLIPLEIGPDLFEQGFGLVVMGHSLLDNQIGFTGPLNLFTGKISISKT